MADIQNVTMLCKNDYESYVDEKFGSEVSKAPVDDEHFEVTVEVDLDPVFVGWLAGLAPGIRALGPAKVIDRLRDVAAELDGIYGRDRTGREHL